MVLELLCSGTNVPPHEQVAILLGVISSIRPRLTFAHR
jgi:hypothetical protein